MELTRDLREFFELLVSNKVRFLLVGGAAVIAHGYVRSTEDFDFWVARDADNARRLAQTIDQFGFASAGFCAEDFMEEGQVFMLGRAPNRVDLLTSISARDFEDCYPRHVDIVMDGVTLPVIALEDLLINKRACGRNKDRGDIEEFERATVAPREL
ncbi:MAG: hypothetical protein CO182_02665 [Lysobacterales bacterium CG_4_9_14_3_um_filter_62_6]|nr:MAG: hypothetical protein CO182_02665 [Xanthomonadales bacterium CG_4_9_14_3_um_filter_62_6]